MIIADNHVDIRVFANQQKTILPFLMMFGNGVKVIAPQTLQKLHKDEITKLNETY